MKLKRKREKSNSKLIFFREFKLNPNILLFYRPQKPLFKKSAKQQKKKDRRGNQEKSQINKRLPERGISEQRHQKRRRLSAPIRFSCGPPILVAFRLYERKRRPVIRA